MRWLYSLNLRAPGSTVLLVANQCDRKEADGVEGPPIEESTADRESFVSTANLVEERVRQKLTDWHRQRVRELLSRWQHRRGISGNNQAASVRRVAAGVALLPQVREWCARTCENSVALLHKQIDQDQRAASGS